MRWQGRRGSRNIEDRRRSPMRSGGGLGIVGVLLVLGLGFFFGIDVSPLLQGQGGGAPAQVETGELTEADQRVGQFVSVTLADTEEVWADIFRDQVGQPYNPTTLVLFKGVTQSPCGNASGATGPFYCPADNKVYLDTSFFTTMEREMGAGGDFAAAYVVAHEVAHHVQDELGILSKANQLRAQSSTADSNAISVRIELQADCYSGVWARQAQERFGSLEQGDIAEAINAAKRIGDDALQRSAGRVPQPHTFTHGTSEQRQRWFATGYETGNVVQCDTFSARNL
ncbi:neutral zinc metallopeptidase [bacterium]|nr:neutral zinc metallopeptidase [bacterium]